MTLKFFYAYIGVFLACSVAMGAVVKQFSSGFAASGKKPYWYGLFSSLIASGAAFLSSFVSENLFTVFWFLAGVYLLFGIVHMVMVHKKYFSSEKPGSAKVILGELIFGIALICFTIVIFSALQFFLKDRSFLFFPLMMSTLMFFVPFLFIQSFEAAFRIPVPVFKTWKYPLNSQIDVPPERPDEKVLVIGFEIAKKSSELKKTYFRARAPETMRLGDLYYFFINDYNEAQSETPIKFADDGYEPYKWWFRRKPKWYQMEKILDPNITIRENGIKENGVIICERV